MFSVGAELEPENTPLREPVIVPVLDPVIVPTLDPVIVPVLLVREPVIVPPKLIAEIDSVSTVAIRVCMKRFISFLLVN